MIFSAPCQEVGQRRVENGITGTVLDAGRDKVAIQTHEREPREVSVDTRQFSDLNLAYAVHVYKAQGITAQESQVLIGGWQSDREHAYIALSRARERTHIYVSREDLGEEGMDVGAIQQLGERIRESRAQEASVAKEAEARRTERQVRIEQELRRDQELGDGLGIE